MSSQNRFTVEFKRDAEAQVVYDGYAVSEVAERRRFSPKSLYTWKGQFSKPASVQEAEADLTAELRRVKKELACVTEARDTLKSRNMLRAGFPVKYGFIWAHQSEFSLRTMCRVLTVHVIGFYAWLKDPLNHACSERRSADGVDPANMG